MATQSSILALRTPLTEGPGYSPQGRKESDTTEATQYAHIQYDCCKAWMGEIAGESREADKGKIIKSLVC